MIRRVFSLSVGAFIFFASHVGAVNVPGGVEIVCEANRNEFRSAAQGQGSVTFRLWDAEVGGTQVGIDYVVPMAELVVEKVKAESKYDNVKRRGYQRIEATIGSDSSPVDLGTDDLWIDITVGSTTLTCDEGKRVLVPPTNPPARRRIQAVSFARESSHSETCETCATTQDISASAYASAVVSVPDSSSYFAVPFDLEYYDTSSMHDNSSNNNRFVAPADGKFLVTALVGFAANSAGIREVIMFDSTGRFFGQIITGASSVQETIMTPSAIIDLLAGQYVSLYVTQNSGGPLDLYDGRKLQIQKLN